MSESHGAALRLRVSPGERAVCRLGPDAPLAPWMTGGAWTSVTRTATELSVVCSADAVPAGVRCEGGWAALEVAGPLDFGLTGVLASLAAPLAEASLPLFVVSTFDTDWLLVRSAHLGRVSKALTAAGHHVETGQDPS